LSTYVEWLAPLMFEQLEPPAPQRRHWYEYVIGVVPFQEPELAVSVEPTVAEPEIVGGVWLDGAVLLAALPVPAAPKTAPIASAAAASDAAVIPRFMCIDTRTPPNGQ
jgi:hypothetical protein